MSVCLSDRRRDYVEGAKLKFFSLSCSHTIVSHSKRYGNISTCCRTERLLVEWRKLDHSIAVLTISQWHRSLSACVRARGGHFRHILWCFHGSMFSINAENLWIWGFTVWLFSLSPKCNLAETFYLTRATNARVCEKSRFSTNISLYLGNDTRQSRSYYGMRIGNRTEACE